MKLFALSGLGVILLYFVFWMCGFKAIVLQESVLQNLITFISIEFAFLVSSAVPTFMSRYVRAVGQSVDVKSKRFDGVFKAYIQIGFSSLAFIFLIILYGILGSVVPKEIEEIIFISYSFIVLYLFIYLLALFYNLFKGVLVVLYDEGWKK